MDDQLVVQSVANVVPALVREWETKAGRWRVERGGAVCLRGVRVRWAAHPSVVPLHPRLEFEGVRSIDTGTIDVRPGERDVDREGPPGEGSPGLVPRNICGRGPQQPVEPVLTRLLRCRREADPQLVEVPVVVDVYGLFLKRWAHRWDRISRGVRHDPEH